MYKHEISANPITLEDISKILERKTVLELSNETVNKITACRNYLDAKISSSTDPIYGINTGFGYLQHVKIAPENLEQLQKNLVMSHACGVGDEVPEEIVKIMLFLKIQSLSYGHSGVHLETVQRLIDFFNYDILPVVYTKGSLGASGDLAPLAHLSLPLLGLGEVHFEGRKLPAAEVLSIFGMEPLHLKSKEGLALLNGTQFMSAYGVWCLLKAKQFSVAADVASAISMDAFLCKTEPFLEAIHQIRPHLGQLSTAKYLVALLQNSPLANATKNQVQDPYSFRCIPQVHGASKDAIVYAEKVFITEINSVTDNPNIFAEQDLIVSGGNFHGQPLALALDFLAIALAELGNISERRTYQLISGSRDLPAFLVANPGLNSGLMIPQYTAASLVSENKQLCTPASVDSITSSNGQEDHVSMGANGAIKTWRVVNNVNAILAIEWITATQALEFRRPSATSPVLEKYVAAFRNQVSFISEDRNLSIDIKNASAFVCNYFFD